MSEPVVFAELEPSGICAGGFCALGRSVVRGLMLSGHCVASLPRPFCAETLCTRTHVRSCAERWCKRFRLSGNTRCDAAVTHAALSHPTDTSQPSSASAARLLPSPPQPPNPKASGLEHVPVISPGFGALPQVFCFSADTGISEPVSPKGWVVF